MRNHHYSLARNVLLLLVLATRMTIRVPGTVAAVVSSSTSTNIPNNGAMNTNDPTSGIYTYPFQYLIHGNTRRCNHFVFFESKSIVGSQTKIVFNGVIRSVFYQKFSKLSSRVIGQRKVQCGISITIGIIYSRTSTQ